MNDDDINLSLDGECDCAICAAGLTPLLEKQEIAALHNALLLSAYLTASAPVTDDPEFPLRVALARHNFRNAAAELGGTWTLAQVVAQ